jgi:uncharacterized protein (TIGR03067 family)
MGMKRLFLFTMLAVAAGCSTLRMSDSAILQGTWQASEIGGKREVCRIVISGDTAEFRGADANEWFKATFTVRPNTNPRQVVFVTTASPYPPDIGSTRYAIYRVEDGMIRLTATEPGNAHMPSDFSTPDTRQFELRKK